MKYPFPTFRPFNFFNSSNWTVQHSVGTTNLEVGSNYVKALASTPISGGYYSSSVIIAKCYLNKSGLTWQRNRLLTADVTALMNSDKDGNGMSSNIYIGIGSGTGFMTFDEETETFSGGSSFVGLSSEQGMDDWGEGLHSHGTVGHAGLYIDDGTYYELGYMPASSSCLVGFHAGWFAGIVGILNGYFQGWFTGSAESRPRQKSGSIRILWLANDYTECSSFEPSLGGSCPNSGIPHAHFSIDGTGLSSVVPTEANPISDDDDPKNVLCLIASNFSDSTPGDAYIKAENIVFTQF
jgi:hypothetical protein